MTHWRLSEIWYEHWRRIEASSKKKSRAANNRRENPNWFPVTIEPGAFISLSVWERITTLLPEILSLNYFDFLSGLLYHKTQTLLHFHLKRPVNPKALQYFILSLGTFNVKYTETPLKHRLQRNQVFTVEIKLENNKSVLLASAMCREKKIERKWAYS